MRQHDSGHKHRKYGRNARRPGTARRKLTRPELFHKARNVLQSSGEAALKAWAEYRSGPRVWNRVTRRWGGLDDDGPKVRKAVKAALARGGGV